MLPNNKTTFLYKNDAFDYDLKIKNLLFLGYRNMASLPLSLSAESADITGVYSTKDKTHQMKVSAEKLNLSTPEIQLTNATFKRDDMFNPNSKIVWNAEKAEIIQNDILKAPFQLSLEKTGGSLDTKANIIIDKVINISFAGAARLLTGEFDGNLYIKEFDLSSLKTPLNDISSVFMDKITNLSGKVAVVGRVYLKNSKQISGPMFVSLKNVGFARDDIKVSGLNTVLSLQTLAPLVTAPNQSIFIAKIDGVLPIQNVVADIKFDNQFLRLSTAQMTLAGMNLAADAVMLPLRANSSVLNFKNSAVKLADITPYINFAGATMSGKGSIQLPLEIKDGKILVKDGELKVLNADVSLKNANKEMKTYFENASSYAVRSGSIFIDSEQESDLINLSLSLDGRLQPTSKMKTIRQQLNQKLSDFIKPVPTMPVPDDIVRRQEIVAH